MSVQCGHLPDHVPPVPPDTIAGVMFWEKKRDEILAMLKLEQKHLPPLARGEAETLARNLRSHLAKDAVPVPMDKSRRASTKSGTQGGEGG